MSKLVNNRYICFDVLKCICSFMVICVHKGIAKGAGPIRSICRIAVPIFFMISGFLYKENKKRGKINKQIKKTAKLYIVWSIIYAIYSIIHNYLKGITVSDYLNGMFSAERIAQLLMLNYHPLIGVIWYLGAYLYTLVVFDYLYDKKTTKQFVYIMPIFFVLCVVLGSYSYVLLGKSINFVWTRNFILTGIPCFWLGYYICESKERIINFNKYIILMMIILFSITSVVEYFFFQYKYQQLYGDIFISTIPLSIAVFIGAISFYNDKDLNKYDLMLAKIGKEYSFPIYCIHIIVKNILDKAITNKALLTVYNWTAPFSIFAVCIIFIKIYKIVIQRKNVNHH